MRFSKPLRGEMHPLARLSADQAAKMRQQLNTGQISQREASRTYGISRPRVKAIQDGVAYSDKDY
jgi:predicted XRE-type DNA-binding protein